MKRPINSLRLFSLISALIVPALMARAVTFTNNTLISFGNTNFDGQDIVVTNCVLTVDGGHAFASLHVLSGGVVKHSYSASGSFTNVPPPNSAGLNLILTGDLEIEAGGSVNATGAGYGPGAGPGAGKQAYTSLPYGYYAGSGGGYGGAGGASSSQAASGNFYGGIGLSPSLGSGGGTGSGNGGAGGGLVNLTVGGLLRVDGMILASGADGVNPHSGGGAGGDIRLSAQTFAGSGPITANGGAGEPYDGGGGGGGRIAVYCTTNLFAGRLSAQGGTGATRGGAGTIYTRSSLRAIGQALVDNGGQSGASTSGLGLTTDDLIVSGGASLILTAKYPPVSGIPLNSLLIGSNSWVVCASNSTSQLVLAVTSNAVIQAGGAIIADAKGYPGEGPGAGGSSQNTQYGPTGGGGGNAGFGGAGAGGAAGGMFVVANSLTQPTYAGGAGGNGSGSYPYYLGGAGGGTLSFTVGGTLQLDGIISANGGAGISDGSGGGAGGSLWLTVGQLSGAGSISANGGSGNLPFGGGGSGGRIALYYNSNTFAGTLSACGGAGANWGAAGTVYSKARNSAPAQVVVDNAGRLGTNTVLLFPADTIDLTISGGALVTRTATPGTSPGPIRNLLIASNSWLSVSNYLDPGHIMPVAGNATIQAGGGILLDGKGYGPGMGTGAGRSYSTSSGITGGGAGYGGYGGSSAGGAAGGTYYGSISGPIDAGSGGGAGAGLTTNNVGGAGGGLLQLTVSGVLALDGKITANGLSGPGQWSGGGSGGSLWLTAGKLTGAGVISANGASGDLPNGGGGGGGRIAIFYGTNQFTGRISANGGAGATYGGAGTLYFKATTNTYAQVVVDNSGGTGTNTYLGALSGYYDLTVSGGATAIVPASYYLANLGNLLIASNSWLSFAPSYYYTYAQITVSRNATIQSGGGIRLDGLGNPANSGPGSGHSESSGQTGSGGGCGGYGGASAFGAAGGLCSGSISQPSQAGSGGGNGYGSNPNNLGGAGGGALQMSVTGTLTLDGLLSANGMPGVGQGSGGGSGGSVWLTLAVFNGSGAISANGGAGDLPYGGGGGGGRIAVTGTSSKFTGTMSARGGVGAVSGGAGTVYIVGDRLVPQIAQLVIDNGGLVGTNTPVSISGNTVIDLTVSGGAIANPASNAVRNLLVTSNAWLSQLSGQSLPQVLQLTVTGDATIQAGGGITTDGAGYAANAGTGAGHYLSTQVYGYVGGGAGYGGYGGAGVGGAANGIAYGSLLQPVDFGSGGGSSSGQRSGAGSAGGGAIRLTVSKTLSLQGRISADGLGAGYDGSGGGSGGSVWLTVGTLSGGGSISANGGSGDVPQGGGGSGGRIAIYYATNTFGGAASARGGQGFIAGGAGTIYFKGNTNTVGRMVVDNGGMLGTNTPLSSPEAFNLTVSGGAVVFPSTSNLVLSTLWVDSGAAITCSNAAASLDLTVLSNAMVGPSGSIAVDAKGYNGSISGPGAGQMPVSSTSGSGAGYGGAGGASISGLPGGGTYGSAAQPVDWGSRGGVYPTSLTAFCQGGGAIRLRVGGILTVNGSLSANGNGAFIEGAGGGAGGSIWLTTRQLEGSGSISANGGAGNPPEGGGGGGGRIALYIRTNLFAGVVAVHGGPGASPGHDGTLFTTNVPAPQVIAQSPSGVVLYAVNYVDLTFGDLMSLSPASPGAVRIDTPNGTLASSALTLSAPSLTTLRISFPAQNTLGYYEVHAAAPIQDIYGVPLATTYIGSFIILPPIISGTVTTTNGAPVPYVTLHVTGDSIPALTDANGQYAIEVLPSWVGSITPSKGEWIFIPSLRSYTNVVADLTNQNFVMATPAAVALACGKQGTNVNLSWYGLNGVTYRVLYSTNLSTWWPWTGSWVGTNGPMSVPAPAIATPRAFYRLGAGY